jgi:hypothetical protein
VAWVWSERATSVAEAGFLPNSHIILYIEPFFLDRALWEEGAVKLF